MLVRTVAVPWRRLAALRKPDRRLADDDDFIRQRGRSEREIAKARRCSVAQINEGIDRWAATSIDDKIRKNTLALELARLDELQETFYARAREGDVQCGVLGTKIIERRGVMLSVFTHHRQRYCGSSTRRCQRKRPLIGSSARSPS
jgi:hypothetical protein